MDQQEQPVVSENAVDRYFEQQVSRYQHELYTYALRLTRHPQDAEDIFQEAIIRAYLAVKSYSLQEVQVLHPRSWLYKIMTNVFLNAYQKMLNLLIPPHDYFVLGDNRVASDDSRDWGFVSLKGIIGKVVGVHKAIPASTPSSIPVTTLPPTPVITPTQP